jgi:hypothetical protein
MVQTVSHPRWHGVVLEVPNAGGAAMDDGYGGDNDYPHYDTEVFRYSPDTGIRQLTRQDYEPDDAQLGGLSAGRVIWAGVRLPAEGELPLVGPGTVNGSIWNQRDAWREIYARTTPVSSEDFVKSALQGFAVLCGIAIDLNLSDNDFNKNGKIDLGDIAYCPSESGGLR